MLELLNRRGDDLKKKIGILIIALSILSFSEEKTNVESFKVEINSEKEISIDLNIKESPSFTSETAIELPQKTIYDFVKEKKYLEPYGNGDFIIEPSYNDKKEVISLKFSKGNFYLYYEFYSFSADKISKITKWDKEVLETKEYDNNGILKKTDIFSKGQRVIEEFDIKKRLIRKEVEGKEDKSYELYYENGKLKEKGQYILINGIYEKDGIWEEYYESGRVKNSFIFDGNEYYQINYLDDRENSKNFEGKSIFEEETWYKDGLWTFYDNGKLSYRADFLREQGKFYNYYDEDSNNISIETSVVLIKDNWVWEGQKIFYGNTGKILEKQYKEGNILSITGYYENEKNSIRYKGERDLSKANFEKIGTWIYFGENEKIEEVIEYKGNEAKIKEYIDFENNKLKFSGTIVKNGEYYSWLGLQNYYDKNGKKEMEVDYQKDGYGKIIHYYDNGRIFKEGLVFSEFIQNPSYYVGTLKEYDRNGKLKVEYNYEKGLLEGETLYYDNNGKLSVKKIYENGELIKIENIK